MNKQKMYFVKIAEKLSDKVAENELGIMYVNTSACKNFFVSKVDSKNLEKELDYTKYRLCEFCNAVYNDMAEKSSGKKREFLKNAAMFYTYEEKENHTAEEFYNAAISIFNANNDSKKSETKENDLDFTI